MFRADWPTSAAPGCVTAQRLSRDHADQPILADTYERVLVEAERRASDRDGQLAAARDVWYAGFVAEELGRFATQTRWKDATGEVHSGLLTAEDIAAWRPGVEAAASYDYGRYTVCKTPAWGRGRSSWRSSRCLPVSTLTPWVISRPTTSTPSWSVQSSRSPTGRPGTAMLLVSVSCTISCSQRTTTRRDRAIGRRRRQQRAYARAGPSTATRLGYRVAGRLTGTQSSASGVGEPTVQASGETRGDTCHIDVVDAAGNLVSATPSGGWLQSSPFIPDLGFCLGSRAQMFWLDPGLPSSLAPGRRPRTTLSPSIALRDGEPWLAFGTPGGDQQDQWSLAFFLAIVHGHHDLQAAIEAPSYHSDHFPSSFAPRLAMPGRLAVEDRMGTPTIAELRRRGHDVVAAGPWSLGRMSAVGREGDIRLGAANPRGAQGYAAGR